MNIAFFLVPKKDVVYLTPDSTIRQALERMEYHRYTAVPLLDDNGKYVGTLTEGDLLWKFKNTQGLHFDNAHRFSLRDVSCRVQNKPVHIDAEIEDLISLAVLQNFIPVVDDNYNFIGIIRRSEIINYCSEMLLNVKTVASNERG